MCTEETFQTLFLALLARAGLTQKAVAELAGISKNTISRFVQPHSKQRPLHTLARLCDALKCSRDDRIRLHALSGVPLPELLDAWEKGQFVVEGSEIVLRAKLI